MIDLLPEHLQLIKKIISVYAPDAEVRVFGSRIKGNAKKHSDIDLALVEPQKIQFDRLRLLKEAFQESDLPIRVDVVDWYSISDSFRAVVEAHYETLQPDKVANLHK